MLKFLITLLTLTAFYSIDGLEKLQNSYLISFGDPAAGIKITEYFSFMCPHCIKLFRTEFKKLKAEYLDNKKASFIFHPLPVDLVTVSAMECLRKLTEAEKRVFLEVFMDETETEDPNLTIALMEKAMELFEKPVPELRNKEYLQDSKAFLDAFQFLKQEEIMDTVPAAEINGKLYPHDVPDLEFLEKVLKQEVKHDS